jgi:hypothetical protein
VAVSRARPTIECSNASPVPSMKHVYRPSVNVRCLLSRLTHELLSISTPRIADVITWFGLNNIAGVNCLARSSSVASAGRQDATTRPG